MIVNFTERAHKSPAQVSSDQFDNALAQYADADHSMHAFSKGTLEADRLKGGGSKPGKSN